MASTVELPIRTDDSDKVVSLDDLLSTLKVAYTITACTKCGRMVTLSELTRPVERQLALV